MRKKHKPQASLLQILPRLIIFIFLILLATGYLSSGHGNLNQSEIQIPPEILNNLIKPEKQQQVNQFLANLASQTSQFQSSSGSVNLTTWLENEFKNFKLSIINLVYQKIVDKI